MIGGGLVIAGRRVPVHHVDVTTWVDDPKRAPPITDGSRRDAAKVQAFVFHTSRGRRAGVKSGARPSNRAELLARYQSRTTRSVSWHLTIDTDGTVLQQADLAHWAAWHAESANGWTIGAELVQHEDDPSLWEAQLAAAVGVCSAACAALGIPRRVLVGPDGNPWVRPVPELLLRKYGGPETRWAGVLGHCHLVPPSVRGPGDPGEAVFRALLAAGYAAVSAQPLPR